MISPTVHIHRPTWFGLLGIFASQLTAALGICVCVHGQAAAQVEGTYEVVIKKQEEKKQARWSLTEWLAQKDKNRMMDLWLAQNSHSSLYEFFLEAQGLNYNQNTGLGTTTTNHNAYGGTLSAYAGIAGLRAGYQSDNENRSSWQGSLNLRLLGRAMQDTHINLEYGFTGLTLNTSGSSAETFQNQYGGASLDLYLTKTFGVEGAYHRLLPAQSNLNRTMEGENELLSVFIDFGLLRVFGQWKNEFLKFDGGGIASTSEFRQGYGGGVRLYL